MGSYLVLLSILAVSQAADQNGLHGISPDRPDRVDVRAAAPIARAPSKPISPEWALTDSVKASMRMCGANCLFAWLMLRGVDCQLERLRREVPVGEWGSNMADIAEVARNYGEDALVVEGSSSGFSNHAPFIARMKVVAEGLHHYVVVTRFSPNGVEVIDGTSGGSDTMTIDEFTASFTGEAIIGAGRGWRFTSRPAMWPVSSNLAVLLLKLVSVSELAAIVILLTRRFATARRKRGSP